MRDAFDPLQSLESLEQDSPGHTFATAARPDHHQAMVNLCDLIQLEDLNWRKNTSINQYMDN